MKEKKDVLLTLKERIPASLKKKFYNVMALLVLAVTVCIVAHVWLHTVIYATNWQPFVKFGLLIVLWCGIFMLLLPYLFKEAYCCFFKALVLTIRDKELRYQIIPPDIQYMIYQKEHRRFLGDQIEHLMEENDIYINPSKKAYCMDYVIDKYYDPNESERLLELIRRWQILEGEKSEGRNQS